MNIQSLKLSLLQRLMNVQEEAVLKKIEEVLEDDIVAFTTNGRALTRKEYSKEIEAGEADIKAGRTYTTEEMLRSIKG